jgi:hypothetical protein
MPRPPRQRSGDRSQEGRRKPPQEETGAESRFLHSRLKSGDRLTVELIDGSRASGVIRNYTEDTIELQTEDQKGLLLQKSRIRLIEVNDAS